MFPAFNPTTHRGVTEELFGWACYELDEEMFGTHVGMAGSADEAKNWMNGDNTIRLIQVYS